VTSPQPPSEPSSPPPSPTAKRLGPTGFGLAALVVSGICSVWVGVEVVLRTEGAPAWAVTGSFVVALVLAATVVVLAILAWREDRTRGGLWGLLAVAMAASDRVFLALFSAFGGF
jgi:hypothetical protein